MKTAHHAWLIAIRFFAITVLDKKPLYNNNSSPSELRRHDENATDRHGGKRRCASRCDLSCR